VGERGDFALCVSAWKRYDRRMLRRAALLPLALLSLAGCGTFLNVHRAEDLPGGERQIYGGVAGSCRGVGNGLRHLTEPDPITPPFWRPLGRTIDLGLVAACVVDVPLSLVGDTLTLPVTVPAAIDRALNEYYGPGGEGYAPPPKPITLPDTEG